MKRTCLIIFLAAVLGSSPVFAADTKGYVGLSYGKLDADTGVTNVTGTAIHDQQDEGYKVFGGYRINDYISIEGHYAAGFDDITLKGNTGDRFTSEGITYVFLVDDVTLTWETTSLGLSGVFVCPVTEIIQPFAKVGIHRWEQDVSLSSPIEAANFSEDGVDLFYGLGLSVSIIDNLSVRMEFELFDVGDSDADYLSWGVAYSF